MLFKRRKASAGLRLLQVSSEFFPLLKTGGLADVAGALPAALQEQGAEPRVLLPGFPSVWAGFQHERDVANLVMPWGESVRVVLGRLCGSTQAYLIDAPHLFDRPGNPYENQHKQPYADNHRRFAALGWVAAHLARGADAQWTPQVVHAHDWHAAWVAPALAHWPVQGSQRHVPVVFTVHNLAYQGLFASDQFGELGLPASAFNMHGVEFHGMGSFMKAGLYYADHITTVSPTYAQEIQTADQGCGLDGLLRERSGLLSGILNGVDDAVWNPQTDALLPATYHPRNMTGKAVCKAALQAEAGLQANPRGPLLAVVSRLTSQKGMNLVLDNIDASVAQGAQWVVLGSGDSWLEDALMNKMHQHPGQVSVRKGYDEPYAHRIFGGADAIVVPSHYEPCGLTQLYGLKYGCVPVVRKVGGLADSVVDTNEETLQQKTATGVVFEHFNAEGLSYALRQFIQLYQQEQLWKQVRRQGMACEFSWAVAASQYVKLYQRLLG